MILFMFLELASLAYQPPKEDEIGSGNHSHDANAIKNRKENTNSSKLSTINENDIEVSGVVNIPEHVVQKSDLMGNSSKNNILNVKNVEKNVINNGSKNEKNTNVFAPTYERKFFKSRAKKQDQSEKLIEITKQEKRNEREKRLLENQQKRRQEQEEKNQKHDEKKWVKEQASQPVTIGNESRRSQDGGKEKNIG